MKARHLSCSVARYKSALQPDLKGHCRVTITERERERERELGREWTKWKTTARPSKDRDKRVFPLLPVSRTWLKNHLHTINHNTSSVSLTQSIQMPPHLRKKQHILCVCHVCRGAHMYTQKGKTQGSTYRAYTDTEKKHRSAIKCQSENLLHVTLSSLQNVAEFMFWKHW